MIRLSGRQPGRDIKIEITGVRPGEKLAEELIALEECESPTAHPSIRRVAPTPIDGDWLEQGVLQLDQLGERLEIKMCGTFLHEIAESHTAVRATPI